MVKTSLGVGLRRDVRGVVATGDLVYDSFAALYRVDEHAGGAVVPALG